jgi:hypothetical protein
MARITIRVPNFLVQIRALRVGIGSISHMIRARHAVSNIVVVADDPAGVFFQFNSFNRAGTFF